MRGIDLEEADGAQDIGYISNLLTDPSSGYFGDMWFLENEEYFRSNDINSMSFTALTYPNSNSNSCLSLKHFNLYKYFYAKNNIYNF